MIFIIIIGNKLITVKLLIGLGIFFKLFKPEFLNRGGGDKRTSRSQWKKNRDAEKVKFVTFNGNGILFVKYCKCCKSVFYNINNIKISILLL